MKLSGILFASVIIIVCFIYSINLQPVAIGDSGEYEYSILKNNFFNFTDSELMNFDSYNNFSDFLTDDYDSNYFNKGWAGFSPILLSSISPRSSMIDTDDSFVEYSNSQESIFDSGGADDKVDYSQTNVQVTGVDEPDIVKTDGSYLYIVNNNKVLIVKATPANQSKIESEVNVDSNLSIINIFIYENRLVIFAQDYNQPIYKITNKNDIQESQVISPWYSSPDTHVLIIDISDFNQPVEVKDIVVAGSISGARLIGEYVYVITTQNQYDIYPLDENQVITPRILINGEDKLISLENIYYVDIPHETNTINNIVSINVKNDSEETQAKIYMLGYLDVLYVSKNNIYIIHNSEIYNFDTLSQITKNILDPILPDSIKTELDLVETLSITEYQKTSVAEWIIQNYTNTMEEEEKLSIARQINRVIERTTIHRISIIDGEITYESQGDIAGTVNNQFSLSEYNGYLRISSTMQGRSIRGFFSRLESQNNIYVLNMDLEIVSSIQGLAPGERIYSTRFLGPMCYLVTFKQIDPFFVIDLTDPENPEVLGELKIPGYSTYLHPYDDSHIIGIGMQDNNIKISLFDVSDVKNPIELSKYEIINDQDNWRWGQSTALYEHKAFLFDKEKNLLVIPAGDHSKQSAHVFDLTLEKGIELKGIISHGEQTITDEEDYYWSNSADSIKRTLYIDDMLYTISDNYLKINNMEDLSEINTIELV